MATKFCPVCGQERSMRVSTEAREADRSKARKFHCEVCNELVHREPMNEASAG